MSTFLANSKIVLFGDSLTEQSFDVDGGCWASLLANHFQRIADVFCRGFSGYNSAHLKIILPEILKEFVSDQVSAFVLFLGANDCNQDASQHVDLHQFSENYRQILSELRNNGFVSSKILLITPPMYDHSKFSEYCTQTGRPIPSRDIKYVETYVNEVKKIANTEKLTLINLFDKMHADESWENLLCDGLHLSQNGAKLLFDAILPEISKRVLIHRGSLNRRFVDWKEIDQNNPEKSLKH